MSINKRNEGYRATPPQSVEELVARLNDIAGMSIAELAKQAQVALPISPLHGKGFQGELIERFLGASAAGLPLPDFVELGIELKTVPLSQDMKPLESTFICSAPLMGIRGLRFEDSVLWHKLRQVLYVFIVSPREYMYEDRYIAGYHFWTPSSEDKAIIKEDYDELMEMVATGHIDDITARLGTIMQLRPKAADGKALTDCPGPDGEIIKVRPRGFYMRRSFMLELLARFMGQ